MYKLLEWIACSNPDPGSGLPAGHLAYLFRLARVILFTLFWMTKYSFMIIQTPTLVFTCGRMGPC